MSLSAVPRLPRDLVDRQRLTSVLEAATPLVVLHAPMGYGKSVALAQWAGRTPRTGLWMRVREGNGDPRTFVQQVAAELAEFQLLEPGNPLLTAGETLAVHDDPWGLLARGLRRLPSDFTLAVDDADRMADATAVGLIRLIGDLPELAVRIAVRGASAFTEPGLGVVLDTTRLTARELGLTHAEASALVGEERADQLVAAGGAPALARMMVLTGELPGAHGRGPGIEEAARSLLRLRSGRWDARFSAFVQSVATADVVDVELAADLSGSDDAEAMLDVAEAEGLGSWSSPAPRPEQATFAFSPFVRLAAEASLRDSRAPVVVRDIERRVARWEFAHGFPFPALRRALEIGDWELVDDIMRAHWNELLPYGGQLAELCRRVPLLTLRSHPLLCTVLALHANARGSQRLRALEYFALAAYGARTQRATARPADRALLRTIETASYRVSGHSGALAAALDGYAAMKDMDLLERDRLGRNEPSIYNQLGTSLFYGGRTAEALDCFRRATATSDAKGLTAGLQGLALTAGALAVSGDVVDAREVVADATARSWPERWIDGYPGSFYQLARTFIALEEFDGQGAREALDTLTAHRRTIEHWALLTHADVLIALLEHRGTDGVAMLETVVRQQRARHATASLTAARLRHTRALALLAAGDPAGAERAIAKEAEGPRKAVSRARIALAAGDASAALRMLQAQPAHGVSARTDAEHLALTAAAVVMSDPDAADGDRLMARLDAMLRDRGLALPVALVPTNALDALIERRRDGEFADLLERARALELIAPSVRRPTLTPRERAVADELARSETVAQIAAALVVSPNTVKTQLRSLYRKLGVSTRADALRVLAGSGSMSPPSGRSR